MWVSACERDRESQSERESCLTPSYFHDPAPYGDIQASVLFELFEYACVSVLVRGWVYEIVSLCLCGCV